MTVQIGVDTGGTHTDIVLLDREDGAFHTLKVPTTPEDLSIGILNGVTRILRETGKMGTEGMGDIAFHYGTTLVTNIIVEEQDLPIGLLTTGGFRDVLEIGRAVRKPNIYDIHWRPQRPLVPRALRRGVPERIDHKGRIVTPLDEATARTEMRALREKGVLAVAICLLNAYANPVHERRLAEIALEELPGVPVTLSSDVAREFREYERTSTTALNAFVLAPMIAHLDTLTARLKREGAHRMPFIMRGNGGIMSFDLAKTLPAAVTHSGPVAGIVGGNALARATGVSDAITFDMGGTSSDVALISGNVPFSTTRGKLAGYPVLLPMLDLVTIGAGGGSIAWIDSGGGLKVGPRSAGSVPGPACYGQGGENPTVTDANLLCGRLNGDFFLNGDRVLRQDLAEAAIRNKIATPLGLSVEEAALGILAIAEAHMVNAIKLVSVQRGIDPRGHTLIGFGGAGPLHAVSLAEAIGMKRVLIPAAPGNVSASGLLAAEVRHDMVRTRVQPLESAAPEVLADDYAALVDEAAQALRDQSVPEDQLQVLRAVDLRYRGQAYELTVPLAATEITDAMLAGLAARFHEEHQRVYGYRLDHHSVEIVNLRVTATSAPPPLPWPEHTTAPSTPAPIGTRAVLYGAPQPDDWPVYRFTEITAGAALNGPAIIEYPGSTCVIPPGWNATWDAWRHAHITHANA
ncbi:hydantoinase/oxoprolinase family protein [Pararhodobacter sp.]|uniref:hydantoinase/oxoprolinase family protein n=1 Tax=Pararhodobacter sp. TaxID=2127056 RepID=UPI002FDD8420